MSTRRTVGVLGGMGPLATVDLYRKIIEATPAQRDQDHLHVIIDADPTVPDRTEALLQGQTDPTPWLIAGAKRLAGAGADFIVMPCNTAHAFLREVEPAVSIPFINMITETAKVVAQMLPSGGQAGVLATAGTVAAGLYQAALEAVGIDVLIPSADGQAKVNRAIAAVKAGDLGPETVAAAVSAAEELTERGAGVLLAACTELPLILHPDAVAVPLVDPTDVLARAAVQAALESEPVPTGRA